MRKRDPISAFLGRLQSPWSLGYFEIIQKYRHVKESEDKFDDWMRRHFGITNEPPEVWTERYTAQGCRVPRPDSSVKGRSYDKT
jgi:hypothetical protein